MAWAKESGAEKIEIVVVHKIAQQWHVGFWSPAHVVLADVQAGDAIIVGGVYWGDLPRRSHTAPRDEQGTLVAAVDQGPGIVGAKKPPVFAQLYHELHAAPGRHVIRPPYLGGVAGDGTFYVLQVRGLGAGLRAVRHSRVVGSGLIDLSINLAPGQAQPGDLVVAIGGYDNTACQSDPARFTDAPPGWTSAGVQDDAANNVPSGACWQIATAERPQATWTWVDPTVNVGVAVIAAYR